MYVGSLTPLVPYAQLQGISTAGGLDESPEELRVKAVQAIVAGNVNEYVSRLAS